MKIAYFDCSSGVAGNMVLGALIDAGVSTAYLEKKLSELKTTNSKKQTNYKLQIKKIKRNRIQTTNLTVIISHHRNHRNHRNLASITAIINKSKLSKKVKKLSIKIFKRLAEAEAKVHCESIHKVHFHEVGAIDAIIDIVGTAICLEKLGIETIFASPIPFGSGKIKCAHGVLPVPVPATAELTKNVPTYGTGIKGELVTPTGAAIITEIVPCLPAGRNHFTNLPKLKVEAIGRGSGSKIYKQVPGYLQVFIGQASIQTEKDTILQIEANIDDMKPKLYDSCIKKLMRAGALDVYIEPIRMKKQRNAIKLTVLCDPEIKDQILDKIFNLTTTFGVRIYAVAREKLSRKHVKVGKVRVKMGYTLAPEFEDIKKTAEKHKLPIKGVYKETWKKMHPGKLFS